jgi:multidrug efflux pump subunit AcrA (membrane-fusion protein)
MKNNHILIFCVLLQTFNSCRTPVRQEPEESTGVSVKVGYVSRSTLEDDIILNGTTMFLRKTVEVSPISGYVAKVNIRYGQPVSTGDILFEIQTKESRALGSEDKGIITVRSAASGYVSELNIPQPGSYIAEGSSLCTVTGNNDVAVKIYVPVEYLTVISRGRECRIILQDRTIKGTITTILPVVDESSQTQSVLVSPDVNLPLPENLNVRVSITREKHSNVLTVPKASLMTDETQTEFWVMKVDSHNIAVKVPVTKGLENDSIAEVISTTLSEGEPVISEGAYGLPDKTPVSINR